MKTTAFLTTACWLASQASACYLANIITRSNNPEWGRAYIWNGEDVVCSGEWGLLVDWGPSKEDQHYDLDCDVDGWNGTIHHSVAEDKFTIDLIVPKKGKVLENQEVPYKLKKPQDDGFWNYTGDVNIYLGSYEGCSKDQETEVLDHKYHGHSFFGGGDPEDSAQTITFSLNNSYPTAPTLSNTIDWSTVNPTGDSDSGLLSNTSSSSGSGSGTATATTSGNGASVVVMGSFSVFVGSLLAYLV